MGTKGASTAWVGIHGDWWVEVVYGELASTEQWLPLSPHGQLATKAPHMQMLGLRLQVWGPLGATRGQKGAGPSSRPEASASYSTVAIVLIAIQDSPRAFAGTSLWSDKSVFWPHATGVDFRRLYILLSLTFGHHSTSGSGTHVYCTSWCPHSFRMTGVHVRLCL